MCSRGRAQRLPPACDLDRAAVVLGHLVVRPLGEAHDHAAEQVDGGDQLHGGR